MKKKIIIMVLIIVFAIALIIVNKFMSKQNKNILASESDAITYVNYDTLANEYINSGKKVVLYCYTSWCEYCSAFVPILEEVAAENTNENIVFLQANIEAEPEIDQAYGIYYLPTILIFKDGENVDRGSGYMEKEKLLDLIDYEN